MGDGDATPVTPPGAARLSNVYDAAVFFVRVPMTTET